MGCNASSRLNIVLSRMHNDGLRGAKSMDVIRLSSELLP